MPWFAAHAIIYLKCLDGAQDSYVVWENVYLIEAADRNQADQRARERASQETQAHDDPALPKCQAHTTYGGRPARWEFAGIRKVVDVFHLSSEDVPGHGDELTFNALAFTREADIRAFADAADLSVQYHDRLSEPEGTPRW